MNCPNCHFENPDGAKFCQNCGHKLEQPCPNCGTANAAGAKFCMNCGTRLAVYPTPPPGRPEPAAGERRVVTILFCDVKGSTALAEQLDPERWTEIIDGAFERLTAAIQRYDGTVARLMGDAVLAFFGAPTAHEDDPLRAVRAGLDILADMRPYQRQVREQLDGEGLETGPSDFEVRVGINTGLVVVGHVGSETAGEYTAMGDAVNVAARMEQTAEPGTVQIARETYRLVAPLVDAEALGAIEIRGKREPVAAYRVKGLKADPARLRGIAGMEAPLIGRRQELAQLSEVLAGLNQGLGGVVFITGEAGLGKSRLLRELQAGDGDARPEAAILWYQVASLSFEDDQPYGLVRRLIRRLVGAAEGEAQQVVWERVDRLLADLAAGQREQFRPALQALFGTANGGGAQLEGQALEENLANGIAALWEVQAAQMPAVLVLDDLHWTDPASMALLAKILPLVDQVSILFFCLLRPDRNSPAWRFKQQAHTAYPHRYLEIQLHPLTSQESMDLATTLLAEIDLPDEFQEAILDKAEGIPFFLEELVREMVESGVVAKGADGRWLPVGPAGEIAVPENLELLLVSRMDRLEAPARHTLQLASVIGRTFYYQVLSLVAGDGSGLNRQLLALQQAGLIQEVARLPEREYAFRHALTQEAAYNTILLKERRQYHRKIGEVMAELFASQVEDLAPVLARHFDRAGDLEKAAFYYATAARQAARLYANDEALGHYSRALDAAGKSDDIMALPGLYRGRGIIRDRLGRFDDARADLEKALESARSAGDKGAEWRALLDLGKLWAARDYDRTGDFFRQALELARQMDDPATLASSLNRIGNWYVNAGRPGEGIAFHHEALALFNQLNDMPGLAGTRDLLGMASMIAGDMRTSVNHYRQAVGLFRELDDRQGIAASQTMLIHGPGTFFTYTEVPVEAPTGFEPAYEEALPLARQIGWRAGESFALQIKAVRDGLQGEFGRALAAGQEALDLATAIEHHQWIVGGHIALGTCYLAVLAPAEASRHLEQALALAKEIRSIHWQHTASGYLAQAYLGLGQPKEALETTDKAIGPGTAVQKGVPIGLRECWLARAEAALIQEDPALSLDIVERMIVSSTNMRPGVVISILWLVRGRALMALGRSTEAEDILRDGLENSQRRGEKALSWRFQAALARLCRQTGRPAEAAGRADQALAMIEALAGTITDDGLRANFQQRAKEMVIGR